MSRGFRTGLLGLLVGLVAAPVLSADVPALIKVIKSVGPEGQGNTAAAAAVRELSELPSESIQELLTALNEASPRAGNYLRAAIQALAQKAGEKLPKSDVEAFLNERSNDPSARKLAYDLLVRVDPTAPDRLIPGMIDDPSVELRREAVQRLIDAGNKLVEGKKDAEAKAVFQEAMQAARDDDQVKILVQKLQGYGEKVKLTEHFGFLTSWHVIGPFDNTDKKGYAIAYPPEKGVDLAAELEGKGGQKLTWKAYSAPEDVDVENCGIVDLKKALDNHKGAVTYAFTEFTSPAAQDVDLRLGTPNAWKVWLNGEQLFGREEYHRGEKLDQYRMRGKLKAGKNQVLIKVCQNEQTDDWAQRWQFRLRVCNGSGTAVLVAGKDTALKLAPTNR